jgi:hypothetical protein
METEALEEVGGLVGGTEDSSGAATDGDIVGDSDGGTAGHGQQALLFWGGHFVRFQLLFCSPHRLLSLLQVLMKQQQHRLDRHGEVHTRQWVALQAPSVCRSHLYTRSQSQGNRIAMDPGEEGNQSGAVFLQSSENVPATNGVEGVGDI